ncbi:MAG TPA: glutamate formimidoyltransferase [Thermoanaerobaculia bacterium]|nr:glutamate formimidoyltransferase [Thermoanaerobaculia bacterium]
MPLLECVPNVSEGRRPEVVAALARTAASPGVTLLDVSSDPDHDRTVLTLAGEPEPLHEALLGLYAEAVAAIDLTRHRGVHPRVGAVDVVPFVPLAGATMAEAVAAALRLAEAVAARFELPVFLYEEAARRAERRRLPDLRRGGFEGLPARLADPAWEPDFGPPRLHPTAGATIIGARPFLIAFNALLETGDPALARRIASRVRESAAGGLPAVRAIGVYLESRRRAQVSMNLLDFRRTSLTAALERVRREAEALGTCVVASEIVGLVPEEALLGALREALLLERFDADLVLERRLERAGGVTGAR